MLPGVSAVAGVRSRVIPSCGGTLEDACDDDRGRTFSAFFFVFLSDGGSLIQNLVNNVVILDFLCNI